MPSLVVLQSARNEMFDFLVDEAARSFVHFVTHYGNASSHCFCKRQSAVFALTGYAKPTCAMLRLFFSGCLLVSGRGVSRNQSFRHRFIRLRNRDWKRSACVKHSASVARVNHAQFAMVTADSQAHQLPTRVKQTSTLTESL